MAVLTDSIVDSGVANISATAFATSSPDMGSMSRLAGVVSGFTAPQRISYVIDSSVERLERVMGKSETIAQAPSASDALKAALPGFAAQLEKWMPRAATAQAWAHR